MTPTFGLHAIAQFSTLRILDSLVEGSALAGLGALLLRMTPRQNAAARFAVWFSTLLAIAGLPLIVVSTPHRIISATITRPAVTVPESWAFYLFAVWALIAGYFLFGVVTAVWHLRRLRKSCDPIDSCELDPIIQETLRRYRMERTVELCTSDQVKVPTAIGLMNPAVIVPRWVMSELSAPELNQILLHELAHLRRRDDWTNLIQQVVKALFFFHPAVWWIEKRIALEREMACDDAVLAQIDSPRAYAECLANLAERSFIRRSLALAQAALGRVRQTSQRIAEILDVNRPKGSAGAWKPAVWLVAGFAMAFAVLGASVPSLVEFSNDQLPSAGSYPVAIANSQGSSANTSKPAVPRPTNASFTTSSPKIQIVPAKLNTGVSEYSRNLQARTAAIHSKVSQPEVAKMLHMASADSGFVPFTETLFVVIEDGNALSDAPVYRIQMWHVLTFQQGLKPASNKAPQKQT